VVVGAGAVVAVGEEEVVWLWATAGACRERNDVRVMLAQRGR